MKSIFKLELKRVFANRGFVIALGIGLFIFLLHSVVTVVFNYNHWMFNDVFLKVPHPDMLVHIEFFYPQVFYSVWLSDLGIPSLLLNCFFFMFPLLICLPFARTFSLDKHANPAESSVKKPILWCARLFSSFLSAAVIVAIPLTLGVLATSYLIPSIVIPTEVSVAFQQEIDQWTEYISYILPQSFSPWIILLTLFAGLLALLGTFVTYRTKKVSLGMLASFITYTLLVFSVNLFRGILSFPAMLVRPFLSLYPAYDSISLLGSIGLVISYAAVLAALLFIIFRAAQRKKPS